MRNRNFGDIKDADHRVANGVLVGQAVLFPQRLIKRQQVGLLGRGQGTAIGAAGKVEEPVSVRRFCGQTRFFRGANRDRHPFEVIFNGLNCRGVRAVLARFREIQVAQQFDFRRRIWNPGLRDAQN